MTFLFATTNPNKVREVRHALRTMAPHKGVPYEILTLADVGSMPEPEETGTTYWENARIKALAYAHATDLTTIAEDSGFEVDALGGAPGVQSARFLGAATSYPDRFAEIYRRDCAFSRQTFSLSLHASSRRSRSRAVTSCCLKPRARSKGPLRRSRAGNTVLATIRSFCIRRSAARSQNCLTIKRATVSHRARAFRDLHRWLTTRE